MEVLINLLGAIAQFAWPAVVLVLLFKFADPLRKLIESAKGRKFTLKVAGNELTMEEASEQQRKLISDLQAQLADVVKRLPGVPPSAAMFNDSAPRGEMRVLWVDDNPRNNSVLVAALEDRGARVDTALNTEDGLARFQTGHYDVVISDMARPEGERAGLEFARTIRARDKNLPVFVFCGHWAARNLRDDALQAGATGITSSGAVLLNQIGLSGHR